jgi:hypothetical protein
VDRGEQDWYDSRFLKTKRSLQKMISEALLKIVRRLFKRFGVNLIDANCPFELWDALQAYRDSNDSAGHHQEADFLEFLLRRWTISKSQLFQDIFVLQKTFEKSCGFFVDFGGTDGVVMSNSALLEFDFGWKGIVAEPARRWHESLFRNRCCSLDTRCVWHTSGLELEFNEAPECETLHY